MPIHNNTIEFFKAAIQNLSIQFLTIDETGFVCAHAFPFAGDSAKFADKETAVATVLAAGWKPKFSGRDLRYICTED